MTLDRLIIVAMVTPTLVRKKEDFDDEETSDEDDLNTTRPRNRKSDSLQSLSGTRAVTISDEDTSGQSATERKPKALPQSEKVTWSDDEEPNAVYNNFKRRKTDARKKVAARTRKAKAAAAESTIVGRRSQTTIKLRNNSATLGRDGNAGVDSDDDDTPDVEVPQFLKDRRSEWEIHRQALGEAGLSLPPNYDDVDFSHEFGDRTTFIYHVQFVDYESVLVFLFSEQRRLYKWWHASTDS